MTSKKASSELNNKMFAESPPTMEELLCHMIVDYQQVNTAPAGRLISAPYINSEGHYCAKLMPQCYHEAGCPRNFGDFIISSNGVSDLKAADAFPWYVRSRLRYSCSTLAAMFARFIIPKLKKGGITNLCSSTLSKEISLDDLVITEVLFVPQKTHVLELVWGRSVRNAYETIEDVSDFGRCHHTVMHCRKTGVIVDFSGGQFTGSMFPVVFPHRQAFTRSLPGQLLDMFPCSEEGIQRQISEDYNKAKQSRDFLPPRFTQRVLRSVQEKKLYCWKCLGTASTDKSLKKCLGCLEALYCCRDCQVMHWKEHKSQCKKETTS